MDVKNGVTKELIERARVLASRDTAPEETRLMLTLMIGVYARMDEIAKEQIDIQSRLHMIYNSFTQRLSRFIEEHPFKALFIAGIIFTIAFLWFTSDFRKLFLVLLNLPPDLVPLP